MGSGKIRVLYKEERVSNVGRTNTGCTNAVAPQIGIRENASGHE
jgi:hypothetical protein